VKNPDLQVLHAKAKALLPNFTFVKFEHNLRHKNETADRLANLAMDRRTDVTEDPPEAEGSADKMDNMDVISADNPAPVGTKSITYSCPECQCVIVITDPGTSGRSNRPFTCRCGGQMNQE